MNAKFSTKSVSHNFLEQFDRLTGDTKAKFGDLESARRSGNEAELTAAVRAAFQALVRERRDAQGDPIQKFLTAHPEQGLLWSGIIRRHSGAKCTPEEEAVMKSLKAWVPGDAMGFGLFPVPVSPDLFDLLLIYGAFRDLGVRQMLGEYTRFVNVTGLPDAVVASLTNQGTYTIPADTGLTGSSVWKVSNTFAVLIKASLAWVQDPTLEIGNAVIGKVVPGLAKAIDFCAFSGSGQDDLTSALQTGIFIDANIPSYTPDLPGKTNIQALDRADFINTIGTVAPAALQRPCRWYIYPGFIPALMLLKDGPGDTYLLRTPAQTEGEWTLVGLPVTWTAQAPSLNQGGNKIAAFGEPSSYTVALRGEIELMSSDGADLDKAIRNFRAIMRGNCFTREATGFATLALGAK